MLLMFPPAPTGWHEPPNDDALPDYDAARVESFAACTRAPTGGEGDGADQINSPPHEVPRRLGNWSAWIFTREASPTAGQYAAQAESILTRSIDVDLAGGPRDTKEMA